MSGAPAGKRLVLGLATAVVVLALLEAGLRLAGFHYQRSLAYMQFNFPNPNELHNVFEPDPLLLWRMRSGYDFGLGYPRLNAQGFRGSEFSPGPAPGTLRVACLGDSVTFGRPEGSYPELLAQSLEPGLIEQGQARSVQVMNFGVPGYSSWQGRLLLTKVLADYRPRVVVILFGWNDHWLARAHADKGQVLDPGADQPPSLLRGLRIYQLINCAAAQAQARTRATPRVLRVPPGDYRENIAAMIRACRAAQALPVLATAPMAPTGAAVPDYFVPLGFVDRAEDVSRLHEQYNRIARAAAAEEAVALADLEADFRTRAAERLFEDPGRDVIHPNLAGLQIMADAISELILDNLRSPVDNLQTAPGDAKAASPVNGE